MLPQRIFTNKFKNKSGYVAMMSVLVISAVGVIISISLLIVGMSSGRTSLDLGQGYGSRYYAHACADFALGKIRLYASYSGDEVIDFEDGYCEVLPVNESSGTYEIMVKGVVGRTLSKMEVVTVRTEDEETGEVTMTINSKREVEDF